MSIKIGYKCNKKSNIYTQSDTVKANESKLQSNLFACINNLNFFQLRKEQEVEFKHREALNDYERKKTKMK